MTDTMFRHRCVPENAQAGLCVGCTVRNLALCGALEEDEVCELERIMTVTTVEGGMMVHEEGAPRLKVYSLTTGMLRVYSDLVDGRRQIAGFLLPGDYLGLADDTVYSQSVDAIVVSTLCTFAVRDMDALMRRFPALKDRLYDLTRTALKQARDSQMMLGRLAPVEKLASFLLLLSDRHARLGNSVDVLRLDMGRMDIADHLGLTIETVSRSFTKLRAQNLIRLPDSNSVEIVDRRALTAVAGMDLAR
jgi:CRP/FNR family transcriptional regulator